MNGVVFITGSGRGIGAATAKLAARRGYAVAINYLAEEQRANEVAGDISAKGGRALVLQGDAASEADVLRMFGTIDRELGRLTALVNNAGITGRAGRLEGYTAEEMRRVLDVSVMGSLLCAREAVKRMSTKHGGAGGSIINISSIAARIGAPGQYVDYAAAKAAIDTLTLGLSKEVGPEGIRVNAVRPGVIKTEIHASGGQPGRAEKIGATAPLQRAGEAEEIANGILWLASDEASYTTGALLDITGGR